MNKNKPEKNVKDRNTIGGKSNGFSRLVTFDNNKKDLNQPRHDKNQSPKPTPFEYIQPEKENNFRESALALFGGNADFGWKKVDNPKRPTSQRQIKQPFSIEDTVRRQAHLNSVINAYKNNSLTTSGSKNQRKKFIQNFSQNMKREYDHTSIDADDATWRNTNNDNRKQLNHQYDSISLPTPQKG